MTLGFFAITLGLLAFISNWFFSVIGALLSASTVVRAKKANNKQIENLGYVGIAINLVPIIIKLARVYS